MAVNWGVIGAGGIADRRTIPEGITKAKNAKLVAVMDVGNHNIDLLEFILNSKAKEVSCFTDNLAHKYPVEDSVTVLARFQNGAQGVSDSFFSIPDASSKNILEVYGTKGSILARGTIGQAPGGEMTAYLEKEEKEYEAKQARVTSVEEKIEPVPVNTYQAEIEHFSDCIEKDLEPAISGEEGLWSQKVIFACYQSARSGQVVKL
jgi:predicted dehydrogenase